MKMTTFAAFKRKQDQKLQAIGLYLPSFVPLQESLAVLLRIWPLPLAPLGQNENTVILSSADQTM
jgi:hypothetical protein